MDSAGGAAAKVSVERCVSLDVGEASIGIHVVDYEVECGLYRLTELSVRPEVRYHHHRVHQLTQYADGAVASTQDRSEAEKCYAFLRLGDDGDMSLLLANPCPNERLAEHHALGGQRAHRHAEGVREHGAHFENKLFVNFASRRSCLVNHLLHELHHVGQRRDIS